MLTLLERGIIAARNGNRVEAKECLIQVLKQNNRNEQAWLWLSEVVDTIGEQISCIEQVLELNPNNHTARLALQKLKAQPSQHAVATSQREVATSSTASPGSLASPANNRGDEARKPFRLSEIPANPAGGQEESIHHQATAALPALFSPGVPANPQAFPRQPSAATQNLRQANGALAYSKSSKSSKAAGHSGSIPILPVILFGALSVTAVGGLMMIVLLIFFS